MPEYPDNTTQAEIEAIESAFEEGLGEPVDAQEPIEDTVEAPDEVVARHRKTKQAKSRSIEDLKTANVKTMSAKEHVALITALKAENALLAEQCHAFQENCNSAYAQTRDLREKAVQIAQTYEQKLNYIARTMDLTNQSIKMCLGGDN